MLWMFPENVCGRSVTPGLNLAQCVDRLLEET